MKFLPLLFFFPFLTLSSLHAIPVKVPIEIYTNFPDRSQHPGLYPFIGHLTFRNICDKVIDSTTEWFDPEEVEQGDTIYINVWYLDWFVKFVHNEIRYPYILVSGDVGGWLPHPQFKNFIHDPKLAAWFCRNIVFSYHPKFFQTPMGQDLSLFTPWDFKVIKLLVDAVANKDQPKQHLLYMCHYPRPYGDRDKIVKLFENEPYCLSRNHSNQEFAQTSFSVFYEEMKLCQFTLSPLGLETDCVRTWEALVLDSIPIVEHTFLDPSYDRLPVVMVHDWKEINPAFLEKKYEELKDRKRDEAYFDYWFDLIKGVQAKVKNNELSFTQLEATQFTPKDLKDLTSLLQKHNINNRPLIYKGSLSSIRPFQLANALHWLIFLHDHWADGSVHADFIRHLLNPSLLINKDLIIHLKDDADFLSTVKSQPGSPVFLDLTYYRTSLFISFRTSTIEYGSFRQSLLQDLNKLYNQLPPNSLLCGNMTSDQYVKEILEMFAEENNLHIQTQGSFWFVKPFLPFLY